MTTTSTYDDTQHAMMKCVDNEDSTSALHSNGKTVKLRLIFVNHDGKALEEEFSVNDTVMDVKKRIMHEEKWPKDFLPVSEVGRLRIFSGGKELEDNKTLSESKIMVNPSVPTPIHVSAVPKSVQAENKESGSKGKHSQCFCTIM